MNPSDFISSRGGVTLMLFVLSILFVLIGVGLVFVNRTNAATSFLLTSGAGVFGALLRDFQPTDKSGGNPQS